MTLEEFRNDYRKNDIPSWYSGQLHLALSASLPIILGYFLAIHLENVTRAEWWGAILFGAFYCTLAEYIAHRWFMHRRRNFPMMRLVFKRHAEQHHHFFPHDNMRTDSSRDWHVILFPVYGFIMLFGGLGAPAAFVVAKLTSLNVALIVMIVGCVFYFFYEFMHLMYHLSEDHWTQKLPLLPWLRRHHQIHHRLNLMQKANFNVTYPVADFIFRTLVTESQLEKAARPRLVAAEPPEESSARRHSL
jgi:hypothetical protein